MTGKEIASEAAVSRLAALQKWRTPALVFLAFLLLIPLYQLRISDASNYRQYVHERISNYLQVDDGVYNNTLHNKDTKDAVHKSFNFSAPCENFPDTQGILLVMKTGATEAYEKLPTHFVTHMQCLPDFLLFSDREQQIGKYHLYDALDRVNDTIRDKQEEFKLYKAMQDCPISQADCTKGVGGAWVLDKYKFLWMAVKTWELRPNMDWYVFAEADSYIVWSNLAYWLRKKQNHHGNHYLGSMAMLKGFPFAHGGSGFILSGTLLKKIVNNIPDVGHKYDELATTTCCGDVLIARAAEEVGAKVGNVWPMINGEKPNTLPYGPGQWCEPLMTMHHMNAEEISMVWQFEQTRKQNAHIQIKDMYHTFFAPQLQRRRKDWTNLSMDKCYIAPDEKSQEWASEEEKKKQAAEDQKDAIERHAHESVEACERVCEAAGLDISAKEYEEADTKEKKEELLKTKYAGKSKSKDWNKDRSCFQWRYRKGVCCTAKSFKLGEPKRMEKEDEKWTSGWFEEGINSWIEARGECQKVEWKNPR